VVKLVVIVDLLLALVGERRPFLSATWSNNKDVNIRDSIAVLLLMAQDIVSLPDSANE